MCSLMLFCPLFLTVSENLALGDTALQRPYPLPDVVGLGQISTNSKHQRLCVSSCGLAPLKETSMKGCRIIFVIFGLQTGSLFHKTETENTRQGLRVIASIKKAFLSVTPVFPENAWAMCMGACPWRKCMYGIQSLYWCTPRLWQFVENFEVNYFTD